jgi:hypothetical protein
VAFRGTKRFELIRKLGEGGEGLVYEAHDNERDMRVALKTLRELDATSLYRFKKEFRALTDVSHPNIVGLYDLVSEKDDWFFTMELVEGADFTTYVRPPGWKAPVAGAAERSTKAITVGALESGTAGTGTGTGTGTGARRRLHSRACRWGRWRMRRGCGAGWGSSRRRCMRFMARGWCIGI